MEATSNLHVLPTPSRRRRPSKYAVGQVRQKERVATKQQAIAAGVLGMVGIVLTALSLTHLAAGIGIVTSAPIWECWALGIGIDLGFVALELAKVLCRERTIKEVNGLLNTGIVGTLMGSAILNAFAFGNAAAGLLVYPAVALGISIPALVYCLTRIGCKAWIER